MEPPSRHRRWRSPIPPVPRSRSSGRRPARGRPGEGRPAGPPGGAGGEPVREGETWVTTERDWDWHDIQGFAQGLLDALRLGAFDDQARRPAEGLHPARSYSLRHRGRTALAIGQLDPRVAELSELPRATYVAEVDLAALLDVRREPQAAAPPRFPATRRDLAFVVDEATPW